MQSPQTILLRGGLDLVTPRIAVDPGRAQFAVNYEAEARGYRRTQGYERLDGRPSPSDASYYYATFDTGLQEIVDGDTLTGATSGATGVALGSGVILTGSTGASTWLLRSGTWDDAGAWDDDAQWIDEPLPGSGGDGDAEGWFAMVDVTGTFQNGETLEISAADAVNLTSAPVLNGAPTDALDATLRAAAIEARRSVIAQPAGSGPVRGVWLYGGEKYCFRNNAGATAGVMFKATTSGWAAQSFGHTVDFTAGTAEFLVGETLTKDSTTATIRAVVLTGGAWDGSAVGYLVVSDIDTGPFTSGTGTSASGSATLSGAEVAITLAPGGHYEFVNHNFLGSVGTEKMYGAYGEGRAFEWDGTYMVPIRTGLSDALDKPTHIAEYANHLFLGYSTGAVLHSGITSPLSFTTTSGAGEIGMGVPITGLVGAAKTALVVLGTTRVSYLTGTSASDFNLLPITGSSGAKPWTGQDIVRPTYVDTLGIRDLSATQDFGNWNMGALSLLVEPLMRQKEEAGTQPSASVIVRGKDQYRVYYDDGTGLVCYVGRGQPEIMPFEFPDIAYCACSGDDTANREVLLMGSSDGWVYQLDKGTSFDGDEVGARLFLHFASPNGTHRNYRFHKAIVEIDGSAANDLSVTAEYSYGGDETAPGIEETFTVSGGGAFWDVGFWDAFYWDTGVQGQAEAYLDGQGFNCAVAVMSDATYEDPHTLSSLRFNYTVRGFRR